MGNSLFPTELSGAFFWLGGLVGVVLLGVFLILVTDREPALQDSPEADASPDQLGQARVNALASEIRRLRAAEQARDRQREDTEELEGSIRRLVALTLQEEELDTVIEIRQQDLQDFRQAEETYALAYRDWLWESSKGRTLETLTTKDGNTYQSVEFKEISNKGLRVRHGAGAGLIPVHLLPDSLRRELQLDLLQGQRLLRERLEGEWTAAKKAREERAKRRKERQWQQPRSRDRPANKRVELLALIEEDRLLLARSRLLSREISEASAKARGSTRSVPGSLETWTERYERLQTMRDAVELRLTQTRNRILALDPNYRPALY